MKNLFTEIKDEDQKQIHVSYGKYIIKKLTKSQEQQLHEKVQASQIKHAKLTTPPRWLLYLKFFAIGNILGMLFFIPISIYLNWNEISLSDYFKTQWAMFLLLGIGIIVFAACKIAERSIMKQKKAEIEGCKIEDLVNEIREAAFQLLELPVPPTPIEILYERGRVSKGVLRYFDFYNNPCMFVYKDEDSIYIATLTLVLKLPLDAIMGIEKVEESVRFTPWQKEEKYNSETFASYEIKRRATGLFQVNSYYRVNLLLDNEEFCLMVLPYDIEALKKIIESE